jgi:hypothetical protein
MITKLLIPALFHNKLADFYQWLPALSRLFPYINGYNSWIDQDFRQGFPQTVLDDGAVSCKAIRSGIVMYMYIIYRINEDLYI